MDLVESWLFTFQLVLTWAIAWRLASNLLPRAATSVFLLAVGLLLMAVPALFVTWLGFVGGFTYQSVLVLLSVAYAVVHCKCPRWRTCGELFSHLAFARGYSIPTAAVAWFGFGAFAIVALNQLRFTPIDADSMWYHLVMPAEWVRTGSTWEVHHWPVMAQGYPGFRQASIAWWSVIAGNEHLALLGVLEFPLLALASYVLARDFGSSRSVAMAAGFAAASTPVVVDGLSSHGNDVALGIYLAASVSFLLRFLRTGDRGHALLGGISIGALAASKFSGPGYGVVVLFVCALQAGIAPLKSLRGLLCVSVGSVLLAAPWYVRNWISFENPLWPAKIEFAGMTFDGPFDAAFFSQWTMGFDLEPLFAHLGYFLDAHGPLVPLLAIAPVLMLIKRRPLRSSIVATALPMLLFAMWLQHPFNLPHYEANYSHRYLIPWSVVLFAGLAGASTALLPKVALAPLFGLSALYGFAGASSLIWVMLVLAVALAFVPRRWMVQDACHGLWNVMCELRMPRWAVIVPLWFVMFAVQSLRTDWQYFDAVGWRDGSSERGWGACVGYVHREVANSRVLLHGSHFFFPLIGEPWSNEVVVADEPLLVVQPMALPAVLALIEDENIDYVVCCRERLRREGDSWVYADSIAADLQASAPGRFEVAFEDRGSVVLRRLPRK